MIDDGEQLDPVIADRFRPLADVPVPDTWNPNVLPLTRRRRPAWMVGAAAAAVIMLVVGVTVVLSSGGDGDLATVDGTSAAPPSDGTAAAPLPDVTSVTTSAPPTTDVLQNALATAEPGVVARGSLVTITPSATIERYCTDIVAVLPVGDGPVIGQVLGGATWQPVPEGAPGPTWPACLGPVTDAPLALTVPDLPDGSYRFCIASGELPEGCALVSVRTDGPAAGIVTEGVAEPAVVVPGQLVSIAPAEAVRRACTALVAVYDAVGSYRGHVGGAQFTRSPGDGDSASACEGDVSGDPIQVNAPDLPAGDYVFCVSDDLLPEGCAGVTLQMSSLLATSSPSEVATGDTITITPAGVVQPICTGVVLVYDVTRTVAVRQVYDPSTGASEPPPAEEWAVPDCLPEPSDEPLTLVVPDLLLGAYAFCLSADLTDASCALVFVTSQRFVEPTVPPGSTVPFVATSVPEPVVPPAPIVVTGSDFFGVRPDVTLATADAVLREATAVLAPGTAPPSNVLACLSSGPATWLTLLGGMYVVWEGEAVETAQPSNWGYTGGAVIDGRAIATDTGVTIGTHRDEVIAAYGSVTDYGDEIHAAGLRFRLQDGVVVFIGHIDCGD